MTNEIKDILKTLKKCEFGACIPKHGSRVLLDYITNLQEENERLKEWKEDLLSENIELENIRKEAIEYIEDRIEDINNGGNEYEYRSIVHLEQILQGEDNEFNN